MSNFNGDKLRFARQYRGLTIDELANLVNVTRQAISQFENTESANIKPKIETLIEISNALKFPLRFFTEDFSKKVDQGSTYFRSLMSTNNKERVSQKNKADVLLLIYDMLKEYVDFPKVNIMESLDKSEKSIENLACELRMHWGLGDEPVRDVVREMEKNGILITSFYTNSDIIDAFTKFGKIDGIWYNCVVLGEDKNKPTRRQFDAAHELGHIIMHSKIMKFEDISKEEFRQIEREADDFAAEFLLPRKSFERDLIYPNNIKSYINIKKKWNVSIAAMIVRAYRVDIISQNTYQYLMKQYNILKMRQIEPLESEIVMSKPVNLKKAIKLLFDEKVFNSKTFMNKLYTMGIVFDSNEIEELMGLDKGTLTQEEIVYKPEFRLIK